MPGVAATKIDLAKMTATVKFDPDRANEATLVKATINAGYPAIRPQHTSKPNMIVVLDSVLTCPQCGFAARETMPTDACQFFYECSNCKTLLRPKRGDCCVFCSFGSVECPPIQEKHNCCG